jgi:2-hydroxycyclohexanecarboxyl-CoA dehydrogenase
MAFESDRLHGDVAVVTGAASGIGRAVALKLAQNQAVVACTDINTSGTEETVRMITDQGGTAAGWGMDISNSSAVRGVMKEINERYGKITILVNSAAIISFAHLKDCTDEMWKQVIDVNLTGYFYAMREVYPYMKASGGGRIVNFSSSTAWSGTGFAGPHYASAKAGTVGLTKYASGVLAADNIRVNAIAPGLTETPLVLIDNEVKERAEHEAKIPLGRIAQPIDQANVVMFLVSEESSYMTGTLLHVNGGKYTYGS